MKAGLVLIVAGVFVGAQILKGGALNRLLGSGTSGATNQIGNVPGQGAGGPIAGPGLGAGPGASSIGPNGQLQGPNGPVYDPNTGEPVYGA